MIYNYKEYKYLMFINKSISLPKFLEKVGAKTGYALIMFTHIYNSIFSECHNLMEDYDNYYQIEYTTFEHFLHRKYFIPKCEAEKIVKMLNTNSELTIIAFDSLSYGIDNIDYFIYGDKLFQRFERILTEA